MMGSAVLTPSEGDGLKCRPLKTSTWEEFQPEGFNLRCKENREKLKVEAECGSAFDKFNQRR